MVDNRHQNLQSSSAYKFEDLHNFQKLTNDRYNEVKSILERNAEDRNNLHGRCDMVNKNLTETTSALSDKVRLNYKELHDFTTEVEKQMLASIR